MSDGLGLGIGIVAVVLSLFTLTPAGTRFSVANRDEWWARGQHGKPPKTALGTRLGALLGLAVGIAFIVTSI